MLSEVFTTKDKTGFHVVLSRKSHNIDVEKYLNHIPENKKNHYSSELMQELQQKECHSQKDKNIYITIHD